MIELAEANVLAAQLNEAIQGKQISKVIVFSSPHKFTFFHGDLQPYEGLLKGKRVGKAAPNGGQVRLEIEDLVFVFGDGVALRFHERGVKRPAKHQLLMEFEDGSALTGSVQMYGFLWCFYENEFDNAYYLVAKEKPSPLSEQFNEEYFSGILSAPEVKELSAKAVLATGQRIPGLGNGVLQDILYYAHIHPKKKVRTFTAEDKEKLYHSVKTTLARMVELGGRDTEKDIYGNPGGYQTKLSKNTMNAPCSVCGQAICKEAYLGGSIYYCEGCQELVK